jgi:hypothetical protein
MRAPADRHGLVELGDGPEHVTSRAVGVSSTRWSRTRFGSKGGARPRQCRSEGTTLVARWRDTPALPVGFDQMLEARDATLVLAKSQVSIDPPTLREAHETAPLSPASPTGGRCFDARASHRMFTTLLFGSRDGAQTSTVPRLGLGS